MSDEDIKRLRELAQQATRGEWEWRDDGLYQVVDASPYRYGVCVLHHDYDPNCGHVWEARDEDMDYMADVSPDVLLALLDRLERAEKALDVLRANQPLSAGQVRLARAMSGMTQEEFARAVGVTQQAVSIWEREGAPAKWRADAILGLMLDQAIPKD